MLKRTNQHIVFVAILALFTILSCQKEKLATGNGHAGFTRFNDWSNSEQKFFSTEFRGITNPRTESKIGYHPLIIGAYNQIAIENQTHNFVDSLVMKGGLPYWNEALVYKNDATGKSQVLIPLAGDGGNKTNAIIILSKSSSLESDFVINAIPRNDVFDTSNTDARLKATNAEWFIRFDDLLFNAEDSKLQEAYCFNKNKAEQTNQIWPTSPPINCQWQLVELCLDELTWTYWVSGTNNIPFHLDHDHDGIPNDQDQDFTDLQQHTGLTQNQFTNHILDWWDTNYEDEYGDYYEFWEDIQNDNYEDIDGGQNVDMEGFWEGFSEILDDMWDSIAHHFENILEGAGGFFDDLFDGGLMYGCPWDPIQGPTGDDRNYECRTFYVLVCNDGVGPWWDDIIDQQWCPTCPTWWQDMDARDMLHQTWLDHFDDNIEDYSVFETLVNASGQFDFFSPLLNSNIEEALSPLLSIGLSQEQWGYLANNIEIFRLLLNKINEDGALQDGNFIKIIIDLGLNHPNLNLTQNEIDFLLLQPLLTMQVYGFLQSHTSESAELFANYVIQELSTDSSIPNNVDLGQYNFFDNYDPILDYLNSNTESEEVLNNGIIIDHIIQAPPTPPSAGRLLGGSPANPNGGQDAIGRTNGDITILPVAYQMFDLDPEWVLKANMRFLFFLATNSDTGEIWDGMGDDVTDAYLSNFFSNQNGTFYAYQNETLHWMVKDSDKFSNWLKEYGKSLNGRLQITNGVIDNIVNINLQNRIQLNETKSLTILINDTQKTDVYIVDDQYDFNPSTGDWEATIRVNVTDNFGVDDGDVLQFWNHLGGPGFVSWWMLQHRRNFWPFKTDLWFSVKLKGNIYN